MIDYVIFGAIGLVVLLIVVSLFDAIVIDAPGTMAEVVSLDSETMPRSSWMRYKASLIELRLFSTNDQSFKLQTKLWFANWTTVSIVQSRSRANDQFFEMKKKITRYVYATEIDPVVIAWTGVRSEWDDV